MATTLESIVDKATNHLYLIKREQNPFYVCTNKAGEEVYFLKQDVFNKYKLGMFDISMKFMN